MIKALARDYEIETDNGNEIVTGDVFVGNFEADKSFYAAWFTEVNGKLRYSGEVHLSEKEFAEQVESWQEI